jgi:putative spermidine/putrescine transport system ATP-binding protein
MTDVISADAPAGTTRGTAVEFRGIRRSYGATHALDGLDLVLRPGELLALLGPSGCGKTTALRLLAGFDRPTAGAVLIGGRDVTGVPASKRDTGMVFQAYSLFPTMTAAENVAFGLRMRRVAAARRAARAAELLELVGLGERGGSYPHELSGGQQQRVALARALAVSPSVLLLDEPLSALDARVRLQLRDEIRRLQLAEGITTLFVTHDQAEALAVADRVAVLNRGRLEQVAAPQEVYARPATAFVAEFVGVVNRLPATVVQPGRVRVLGSVADLDGDAPAGGGELTVAVRPEALTVGPGAGSGAPGRVVSRTFLGPVTRLVVTTDAGELVVDTVTRDGLPGLDDPTVVRLTADRLRPAAT